MRDMEQKAARNKTIDFSLEEGRVYVDRCLKAENIMPVHGVSMLGEKMPAALEEVRNQFIIGDSFRVLDILPEKSIDLLIADPPYNLAKNYHGNKFNRVDTEKYRQYTTEWLKKVKPLLKENASVYVCCDWESSLIIGPVICEFFHVMNRITWQREKGRGAEANWKNGMEDIWYAVNCTGTPSRAGDRSDNGYTFNLDKVKVRKKVVAPYRVDGKPKDWEETDSGNYRNTCPSNFWDDISIPYWSMPENTAHPTQKPEKLLAKLILASSNEGDIVLDPFAGSGSTAVTAKKLGRDFIAIEQNELYGAWAQKRLEMADEDSSIQGYCDGVFWERNTASAQKAKKRKLGGD